MALLLQRIIRCGIAFQNDFCCLDLKRLLGLRGSYQRSGNDECCADVRLADRIKIRKRIVIYDLDRLEKRTVMQHDKAEGLGVTDGSYPAADGHFFTEILFSVSEDLSYIYNVHLFSPLHFLSQAKALVRAAYMIFQKCFSNINKNAPKHLLLQDDFPIAVPPELL